jgi:hypothetical protein
MHTMLKATKNTKPAADPIFAAIDAHRRATAVSYPILYKIGRPRVGAPGLHAMQLAFDKAADVEKKATVKLRKIQPTTIAGVAAVMAYFVEFIDHYPDCPWITDPKNWDDPYWFEHALIRNLAAALASINGKVTTKQAA